MLKQRLSAPFEVVYMCDPAILTLSADATKEYRQTRNIEDIDLTKCETPPTVFTCVPLKTEHKHFTDAALSMASMANWSVFRHHVISATNFEAENGQPIIKLTDKAIPDSQEHLIPLDVVAEIAHVIVEKACAESKFFTQPAHYSEQLMLTVARRALASSVSEDTAKNETENSD